MCLYTTPPASQWLRDALNSALTLRRHTMHLTIEAMIEDDWILGAIERRLEVIGEALRRVRHAVPRIEESFPQIHQWIALRNVVAHDYDNLDYEIIWDAATIKIQSLIETLSELLDDVQNDE